MTKSRPKGTGSLTQRSDGRWQAQLQVNGRRTTVYAKSKSEVKAKLSQLTKQAIVQGSLPQHHKLTELLDVWIEMNSARWKKSTLASYQKASRYLIDELGSTAISRIMPLQLQSLYQQYRSKPRTALLLHQTLHAALEEAVRWDWLPSNPADKVKRPHYQKKKKPLWSVEDCQRFLEVAKENVYWPLFTMALATGCRLGELMALRWEDINLARQSVRVERSLQEIDGEWVQSAPKTRSSERTVYLNALALDALKGQEERQKEWRFAAGERWRNVERLVFTSQTGGPIDRHNISRSLATFCRKHSLPIISFHSFRHLNASLALQAGAPLALVSRHLGHSSVAITAAVYAHAMNDGRSVAEAIGKALDNVKLTGIPGK